MPGQSHLKCGMYFMQKFYIQRNQICVAKTFFCSLRKNPSSESEGCGYHGDLGTDSQERPWNPGRLPPQYRDLLLISFPFFPNRNNRYTEV